jgi:hypothetical protein
LSPREVPVVFRASVHEFDSALQLLDVTPGDPGNEVIIRFSIKSAGYLFLAIRTDPRRVGENG